MGLLRYYATDLSWEQVMNLHQNYLKTSAWKPFSPNETYFWSESSENQRLNLNFHQIKDTPEDIEKPIETDEKAAYLVQIGYTQDIAAWEKNCKPED